MPTRLNALLLANLKEDMERLLELHSQLLGVAAIKICATVKAQDFTPEGVQLWVLLDFGVIAF